MNVHIWCPHTVAAQCHAARNFSAFLKVGFRAVFHCGGITKVLIFLEIMRENGKLF
jgi:hypothetical protein